MTQAVELVVGSLDRLSEMDKWLTDSAEGVVRVMMGEQICRSCVGSYNVPGEPGLFDEARTIGCDTTLRFLFENDREASYFKTAWG